MNCFNRHKQHSDLDDCIHNLFNQTLQDRLNEFKKKNKYCSIPKDNTDWSEWAYYCGVVNTLEELMNE